MAIVERHETVDRSLRLIVDLTDGDWSIGFDGFPWHTHGDILEAWGYCGTPEVMVRSFVQDIISSRKPICVYRTDGRITDVVILSDYDFMSETPSNFSPLDETIETRYWDGRPAG